MAGQTTDCSRYLPMATIAIPTYNRANDYLKQSLESALNQSYPNIEIIVADNCSSDNTETYVTHIDDQRIRYFKHNTNIGANRNFNFCLRQAHGEFFLLLSDDDMIDCDFVDTCIKSINGHQNIAMVRTGIRLINANGQVLRERSNLINNCGINDFIKGWFAGKAPLYLCNTMFHTEKLRSIGGFRSKHNLYDDVMAVIQLASKYRSIDIQDIKATTRVHELEMGFNAKISEWCEDSQKLLDLMCDSVSEEREQIRLEGNQVFARKNYARAKVIKAPLKRFIAFMIIFQKFHYCSPPPLLPRALHPRRLRQLVIKMKRRLAVG
jgi:glycosyltransferase involved in cell wall biosynthesis